MERCIKIGKHIGMSKQLGFTYLAVLFLVAMMGAIWASVGTIWSTTSQREKERELLLIGAQFREAISQYYENSPGALKKYPDTLEDLLQDKRQLGTRRYLRKVFIDPMTRSNKWGLVMSPMGGIMGIHSLSEEISIKKANFQDDSLDLSGKSRYSDWWFVYRSAQQAASAR